MASSIPPETTTANIAELRAEIVQWLSPRNLSSLFAVNRRFHQTANDAMRLWAYAGDYDAIYSLQRRMLARVSRGGMDKHVTKILQEFFTRADRRSQQHFWRRLSDAELLALIPYLPSDLPALFLKDCRHFSKDTLFALLRQCQALECLDLRDTIEEVQGDLAEVEQTLKQLKILKINRQAKPFPSLPHCQDLELGGSWGTFVDAALSRELRMLPQKAPSLLRLDLSGLHRLQDHMLLALLEQYPNIHSLDLSNCNCITDGVAEAIGDLTELRSFDFSYTNLSPQVLQQLAGLKHLESINAAACRDLRVEHIETLLEHCPSLDCLELWNTALDTNRLLASLQTIPKKLRSVSLSPFGRVNPDTLLAFAHAHPELEALWIGRSDTLTDETAAHLVHALPKLRHLHFIGCPLIGDRTASTIAHSCRQLETLSLESAKALSDEGMHELALGLPELRHVNLEESPAISDRTLRAFQENCHRLTQMYVRGGDSIQVETVTRLPQMLPQLRRVCLTGPSDVVEAVKGLVESLPLIKMVYSTQFCHTR